MSISQRKRTIRIRGCSFILWLFLISSYTAAQVNASPVACSSPELVLRRYVDAVGGEAAIGQIETRVVETKESEFLNMGHVDSTKYKFKWKTPNKVAVTIVGTPLKWLSATWRFNGKAWFSPQGENSRDNTHRRFIDYRFNMMYRLVADPLMIARAHELYSSFEATDDFAANPGLCILHARRPDTLAHGIFDFDTSSSCKECLAPHTDHRLRDELYFDAQSGLLTTWKIHEGFSTPGYVQFQFDDYREVGTIKLPYHVHVELGLFKADFRYTKIVHNLPLTDSAFVSEEHCTTLLCDLLGANRQ